MAKSSGSQPESSPENCGILAQFRDKCLDGILEEARKSIHLKSPHLEPIYQTIETYFKSEKLPISTESTDTTRQYRVFGPYIFFHANTLANILAEIIPYIRLNTIVKKKEFELHIDGARVIYFYNIDPVFAKIFSQNEESGTLVKIPAEIELVGVYQRLYSPEHYKTWASLMVYETELWDSFLKARNAIVKIQPDAVGGKKKKLYLHNKAKIDIKAHKNIVSRWLESQNEYAIVGSFAISLLNMGDKVQSSGAIQIIVANVDKTIKDITKELEKYIGGIRMDVKHYDLELPSDYRIKKYVLSVRADNKIYYIANLFNCAEYELIPIVIIAGVKVADFGVLLRFLFIELWFLRVIHEFKKMTDEEYKNYVSATIDVIDTVHHLWQKKGLPQAPPLYIGTYINESISKKTNDMVAPYFPAEYKRVSGQYRKIDMPIKNV